MAMVGWLGQGWRWWMVGMRDKARDLVPEHFQTAR